MQKKISAAQIKMILAHLDKLDPMIEQLVVQRIVSGKQVFNSRTHRLRPEYRDLDQAYAVLSVLKMLIEAGQIPLIKFSKDEQKLLNRRFSQSGNSTQNPGQAES